MEPLPAEFGVFPTPPTHTWLCLFTDWCCAYLPNIAFCPFWLFIYFIWVLFFFNFYTLVYFVLKAGSFHYLCVTAVAGLTCGVCVALFSLPEKVHHRCVLWRDNDVSCSLIKHYIILWPSDNCSWLTRIGTDLFLFFYTIYVSSCYSNDIKQFANVISTVLKRSQFIVEDNN